MRNSNDLSMLTQLASRIKASPKEDFDDALFFTLCRASALGKKIRTNDGVVTDHGKKYLRTYLSEGIGNWIDIRRILLDFTDKYVMLDGFLLDDIIIEKGFVEELVSAVDYSQITAVAEDISSYESESACVTDESLTSFPDIRKWNTEAVLTTPLVRYGNGEGAISRLANAYKNILQKAVDGGYHTLSIAPLSDFPLHIEGEIANQSTDIFFSLHPDAALFVTFILPDEESLTKFLGE